MVFWVRGGDWPGGANNDCRALVGVGVDGRGGGGLNSDAMVEEGDDEEEAAAAGLANKEATDVALGGAAKRGAGLGG